MDREWAHTHTHDLSRSARLYTATGAPPICMAILLGPSFDSMALACQSLVNCFQSSIRHLVPFSTRWARHFLQWSHFQTFPCSLKMCRHWPWSKWPYVNYPNSWPLSFRINHAAGFPICNSLSWSIRRYVNYPGLDYCHVALTTLTWSSTCILIPSSISFPKCYIIPLLRWNLFETKTHA